MVRIDEETVCCLHERGTILLLGKYEHENVKYLAEKFDDLAVLQVRDLLAHVDKLGFRYFATGIASAARLLGLLRRARRVATTNFSRGRAAYLSMFVSHVGEILPTLVSISL